MTPRIIRSDEIAPRLSFERLIPVIAQGFRDYFNGSAKVAPITNIDLPDVNGEMHIKPGYMVDGDHVCVKIATCYYDNPAHGLPTRDGLVVLANRTNGRIEAVLCDSGLITDMRTAGASAVAVDALAANGPITLGIVGTGTQARWHARAMAHVRELREVLVWGRDAAKAEVAASGICADIGIAARSAPLSEVAGCNVIVTATPANAAVLTTQKLRPGAVVVAMGADAQGKRELGPDILAQATILVADSLTQCRAVGELQWIGDLKSAPRVVELGAILAGDTVGRKLPEDIVIFDSTGVAFQDVVSASEIVSARG